jgi:ATP-dependent helicase/nuclease subunit A
MMTPMNDVRAAADWSQRVRALDPEHSFIVQAPAGSGKTELLIQRHLALLALVEAPEEIVAITFTRKAAGEMRDRVLQALRMASGKAPTEDHRRKTWELARAVVQRDAQMGWGLAEAPSRLRIQTIDSLCASLTRQMPVLSGFGAPPKPVENAAYLHRDAARRTLAQLDEGGPLTTCIGRVLMHLDNDVMAAEGLLAQMLARRDQWLRHVVDRDSHRLRRETLEAALADLTLDALESLRELMPRDLQVELIELARYAADNLAQSASKSDIVVLLELPALPGTGVEDLSVWRGIAKLLLTDEGAVRKVGGVNARVGFLAPSSVIDKTEKERLGQFKRRFQHFLTEVEQHGNFVSQLHLTRSLPPASYDDTQWEAVEALIGLLPVAVAQLELLFRERGEVDFTAMAQAAVRSLGPEGEPTDLALALDYRIRHLLVDEFQDTSQSQYELLTRLTAGWQPGDGRTLFVVGDPMQSIYRFREADVALYLRARREGIGAVKLEPLTLKVNFRSQAGVVAWMNRTFRALLPEQEDLSSGAVPFSESEEANPELPGPAVSVHPQLTKDRDTEASVVAELVREARTDDPAQRTAILVRSRGHLMSIVPALKQAGLRFRAIEIESLGHRPIVQDLHALTRALLHPADRIAWLSVLRAPWCGLTLMDLDALAGGNREVCIWDLVDQPAVVAGLSMDGQTRLLRLRERLRPCFAQRRREPLRRWVEGAWLALGGPAIAQDAADLDDARVFLGILDELEDGGDLLDFDALARRVELLYALPDPDADDTLQVMTIHKAKGLEFDTVIIPGLGYAPRNNDPSLLLWLERPRTHSGNDLLLAPIRERSQDADPIYRYLDQLDGQKAKHEDRRLLYVAATRAKARLHLVGQANVKGGEPKPDPRSLLAHLWSVVGPVFQQAAAMVGVQGHGDAVTQVRPEPSIRRVLTGWLSPPPPAGAVAVRPWEEHDGALEDVEFSWASETAKHIGTTVHRFLQVIAEAGVEAWPPGRVTAARKLFAHDLRVLGVPEVELNNALKRVTEALLSALDDPRARWVLSRHQDARNEWRLSGVLDGKVVEIAIDRSFVDAHGVRWIVDYKTGIHEGASLEDFLDNERLRYREQLERYATLLRRIESRPIRLALYFPLLKGWREWEAPTTIGT